MEILIVKFALVATTPNKPKDVNDCSQKGNFYLRAPSPVTIENTDAKSDKSMLILITKLSQSQIA